MIEPVTVLFAHSAIRINVKVGRVLCFGSDMELLMLTFFIKISRVNVVAGDTILNVLPI